MIFYKFGVRHFASQRFFSRKPTFLCFLDHIIIFQHFFELKKMRLEIPLRLVQTRARELRYLTISCNLWWFRYQNKLCLSWNLQKQSKKLMKIGSIDSWAKTISGYDTIFDFHAKLDILGGFQIFYVFWSNINRKNDIF